MPKVGKNFSPSHDALNPILVVDLFDVWGIDFGRSLLCVQVG